MTMTIGLTQGKEAIVSEQDFEELSRWLWRYHNDGYACRMERINGKIKTIYMHRQIMNPSDDLHIDHINHDRLDNRRENLRICTNAENRRNQRRSKANTSGYKGVTWDKKFDKWKAQIGFEGKQIFISYSDDKHEAARKYNEKAVELFGEYARLNEIPDENQLEKITIPSAKYANLPLFRQLNFQQKRTVQAKSTI